VEKVSNSLKYNLFGCIFGQGGCMSKRDEDFSHEIEKLYTVHVICQSQIFCRPPCKETCFRFFSNKVGSLGLIVYQKESFQLEIE